MSYVRRLIRGIKSYCYWIKRLWCLGGRKAYLLATPNHINIGDSAIVVAEIAFLKKCGYTKVIEITTREYQSFRKCIVRLMPKDAEIFLPGGGNMGSLWPAEEEWRSRIINDFSNHKIVVFPQTIYYSDSEDAKQLQKESIDVYNTKPKLTIVARERTSFTIMKQLYPNLNVLLTPDIVLSLNFIQNNVERKGIAVCFRNDKERVLSEKSKSNLIEKLKSNKYLVHKTDTMSEEPITVENRETVVKHKLDEFAQSKLVITDRLHGMVFSAITGTPCLVLGNNHHKVQETYEWLKHLDYIKFVEDIEIVDSYIEEMYQKTNCRYWIDPSHFSELENLLKNNFN